MSTIAEYLDSLADDAEEVDLSTFELVEDFDDATWEKIEGFERMKRLKLPPSLLRIRNYNFDSHEQLTDVTFPSSLRSIGDGAFAQCTFGLGTGPAMHDLKLPDSLEELGANAFAYCEELTGKLTTHITGKESFLWCEGLTSLNLDNCKVIEYGCFRGCVGLTELKLPSSLQRIERFAFRDCSALTGALIIHPFVSFIDPFVFKGCTKKFSLGAEQSIHEHFVRFYSWKVRGNVLMTLITFDEEYRRVVEKNGGRLHSDLSNTFLSGISKDAQLIYKATAHVDGTDNLANGICRLVISFLPKHEVYYGHMLSNEEVEASCEYEDYGSISESGEEWSD
jgi:hypothetical protein